MKRAWTSTSMRHRDVLLEDADDAVVMLGRDGDGREGHLRALGARPAARDEDRSELAPAGLDDDAGAFGLEELADHLLELLAGRHVLHLGVHRPADARLGRQHELVQVGLEEPRGHRVERDRQVLLALGEDDGVLELALVLIEVGRPSWP